MAQSRELGEREKGLAAEADRLGDEVRALLLRVPNVPSEEAPDGRPSQARGTVYVRDLVDRSLVFVCRHDRAAQEVVVVTLWEAEGGPAPPRVPRRFTDALRERPPRSAH